MSDGPEDGLVNGISDGTEDILVYQKLQRMLHRGKIRWTRRRLH